MFDVSVNANAPTIDEKVVPNATVKIDDVDYRMISDSLNELNKKDFIPVVYITLDALKAMEGHEGVLASNIVTRVRNMCQYNSLPNVQELQLDCDWTASTESSFFSLCESVKQYLVKQHLPWRLSSTIRLHQLSREVPPVDNGVLMVYNTGNFKDPDATNSIVDVKDVEPYMKSLSAYPLHLDVAYPVYSWQLLFRKRRFIGLLNGLPLAHMAQFVYKGNNAFEARCAISYNDRIICPGDIVREEKAAFKDVAAVKSLIERNLPNRQRSNILYHFNLDSTNLSTYTTDEIDYIFSAVR